MKTRELNYEEISRIVKLMKQCDGTCDIKVADLAKEGGWKKTDLTEYINENIGHFNICQKVERKPVRIKGYPTSYDEKPLGLFLTECYDNVIDNPETEEWLQEHIEKYKKTIWLGKTYYDYGGYGFANVYHLVVDSDERESKWRNTKEKFEEVAELCKEFIKGGKGETSVYFHLDNDFIDLLKKEGWTIFVVGKRTDKDTRL